MDELETAGRKPPEAKDDPAIAAAFLSHSDDPIARFEALLSQARKDPRHREPTAMALATVGEGGRPSSRIVLLKHVDERGFVFYTNLDSRKGSEARARPPVALTFHWQWMEVQVRIEGDAAQVSDAEADAYFAGRPRGSQLGAWASQQSGVLASRDDLERRLAEVTRRFQGKPVPRPPRWSGLYVAPLAIEFWRGREDRLHDRERYRRARAGQDWTRELLYP
jgi:pyridoxamine 5'-phosphate oxidase